MTLRNALTDGILRSGFNRDKKGSIAAGREELFKTAITTHRSCKRSIYDMANITLVKKAL